jgi:hypothetical protein
MSRRRFPSTIFKASSGEFYWSEGQFYERFQTVLRKKRAWPIHGACSLSEAPDHISKTKEDSSWKNWYDPAYKEKIELDLAEGRWGILTTIHLASRYPLSPELKEFRTRERFADIAEARRVMGLFHEWRRKQADAWEKDNPEPEPAEDWFARECAAA